MNILLGSIFYRFNEEDKLEQIKIKQIKNKDLYIVQNIDSKELQKISYNTLTEYTLLKPDGYVGFNIVSLNDGLRDVIITYHRSSDIENGNNEPFAVCRQSISDVYTNITNRNKLIHYVGASIDRLNCPTDVDFKTLTGCNSINYSRFVSYYIGDTLNTILSCIKTSRYDNTLKFLESKMDTNVFKGYSTSLKELLESNSFMYNILRGNNIIPLSFEILYDKEKDADYITEMIPLIENIVKYKIHSPIIVPYGKDIDISKIEQDYIIVSDIKDKVYIIIYKQGKYTNPSYGDMKDKRELEILNKILEK